jgi:hypothetical protein
MNRKDIRIPAIDKSLNDVFKTAAKNKGQTRAAFLRPLIREIVESYPETLKTKRNISNGELHISGIPDDVLAELKIISENLGVSETQLLRIKLFELSNQLPDWLKVNPDSLH